MKKIRTRFAPSPTGYLHVGSLRTALYAFLFAKHHNGSCILRVEDTDRSRLVADATEKMLTVFDLFGIHFDEGPSQGGEHGPYVQSERKNAGIYQKNIKMLLDHGRAYYCFCSSKRLETVRAKQQAAKQPPKYDRHCLNLDKKEIEKKLANNEPHVIRMHVPKGTTQFTDIVRGSISIENSTIDDQVLIKSDGFPTYHFAVVVDDHLMNITHVIRGEEWIPSTPKHIILYNMFGWNVPEYAHLPLLLNPDKSKLSKRQGDVAVEDFLQKGYLKEALLNFIALLGWNPGDDRELFTLEELTNEFLLERVQKSGAVFNTEKLNWMNNQYLKATDSEVLTKRALENNYFEHVTNFSQERYDLSRVLDLFKERMHVLSEIGELTQFVYQLPDYSANILIFKKSNKKTTLTALQSATELAELYSGSWAANELKEYFDTKREERGLSRAEMFWPMRVALSGSEQSPDVFDMAELFGKEETLNRLQAAIAKIATL